MGDKVLDYELAHEFEFYKNLHMTAIVKNDLMKKYENIEKETVNIPSFLTGETPEAKADIEMVAICKNPNGKQIFVDLYDKAWDVIKHKLP